VREKEVEKKIEKQYLNKVESEIDSSEFVMKN
jgi:hypothetical protein